MFGTYLLLRHDMRPSHVSKWHRSSRLFPWPYDEYFEGIEEQFGMASRMKLGPLYIFFRFMKPYTHIISFIFCLAQFYHSIHTFCLYINFTISGNVIPDGTFVSLFPFLSHYAYTNQRRPFGDNTIGRLWILDLEHCSFFDPTTTNLKLKSSSTTTWHVLSRRMSNC